MPGSQDGIYGGLGQAYIDYFNRLRGQQSDAYQHSPTPVNPNNPFAHFQQWLNKNNPVVAQGQSDIPARSNFLEMTANNLQRAQQMKQMGQRLHITGAPSISPGQALLYANQNPQLAALTATMLAAPPGSNPPTGTNAPGGVAD
jgi:hypothetical protein